MRKEGITGKRPSLLLMVLCTITFAPMIVPGSIPRDEPLPEKDHHQKIILPTWGRNHPFLGTDDESALTSEIPIDAGPSLSGDLGLRTSPMAQRDKEHPRERKIDASSSSNGRESWPDNHIWISGQMSGSFGPAVSIPSRVVEVSEAIMLQLIPNVAKSEFPSFRHSPVLCNIRVQPRESSAPQITRHSLPRSEMDAAFPIIAATHRSIQSFQDAGAGYFLDNSWRELVV